MKYINYYSKLRTYLGMSDEAFLKEMAYNKNRVATKVVLDNVATPVSEAIKISTAAEYEIIYGFIDRHQLKRVAFVDWTREINPFYFDFSPMYTTFKIPKRKGGFREICAPNEELKDLQRRIVRLFTRTMKYLPHNAAHGFTKHRNCKTSLEVHKANKSRWFLKLDIKDFFPNTTFVQIIDAMRHVYPFCELTDGQKWLITCACTLNGCTPQGAPTSPIITNMVMTEADVAITKYCKEHDLVYTRYADDILISSRVDFDWETVQADVQNLLPNYQLKTEKTRYGSFNGKNWNLGLMYNNNTDITVGHAKKKLVKNLVHNYETKTEYKTPENYYYLIGLVGYCNYIEPEYFSNYMDRLKANPV